MSSKSLSLFVFGVLAAVLVMGLGSAATVFSDDFNDGNLNGWTITNNPATLSGTEWSNTGTEAEAAPGASSTLGTSNLSILINTSGFENIILNYDRQLVGFDTEEEFKVSWSTDGTNFNVLEETLTSTPDDANFVSKTFNLPSGANNNANFELRIECTANAASDLCRLDNLLVSGTAIPPSPTEIQTCNTLGQPSDMDVRVKSIEFTNNGMDYATFGDDNSWFPFEKIDAQIEIKNYGDYDADNVQVSWGLYDTDNNQWVIEPTDENDFRLKHGDTKTLDVSFSVNDDVDVDLSDLTDGDHYKFYVYAEGTVDDSDSVNDGKDFCSSSSENAAVVIESDFVVLNNINIPDSVQCGATFDVTADVWNVGDSDQDSVSVDVYDKDKILVNDVYSVGDISALDKETLSFSLQVPKNAEEKIYPLTFRVLDENGDVYNNDFNDDDSEFTVPLQVSGHCSPEVSVSASTVSGGQAGKDLVIKATVTNTGSSQAAYTLSVSGSDSWASSYTLDQTSLILGAGESRDVTATFDVNKDASGSQTFSLDLTSDGQLTSQSVTVSIEPSKGFLTGFAIGGDNWYLWGIGALNLILVVVIIIVAVKVARRK